MLGRNQGAAAVELGVVERYAVAATRRRTFRRDSPLAGVVHRATVVVRNIRGRAGSHTVLVYAVPPQGARVAGAPIRSLVGFDKVYAEPGWLGVRFSRRAQC